MSASPSIRPMAEADLPAVHAVAMATFHDLANRLGEPPEPEAPFAAYSVRLRHLLLTDPGGAWVAERDGRIVGCALALVREGVWGLSLLVVDPAAQSGGLGRALLERADAYGNGAHGRIILASRDARALRAYARLGLDLHPAALAVGTARGVAMPEDVRLMQPADRPWLDAVGRAVRGAAHGDDLGALAAGGATVRVLPPRGYAVSRGGALKLLAAGDEEAAGTLLRAHLAGVDGEATVEWLTSSQQWAIRACVDAGLVLDSAGGAVFTGGELGPMTPYLPNGAYL